MSKSFSKKEVADHKTEADGIYIIVDDGVYDVTSEYNVFAQMEIRSSRRLLTHASLSTGQNDGLLTVISLSRVHRRAPGRLQDSEAHGWKGLDKTVLEIPRKECA